MSGAVKRVFSGIQPTGAFHIGNYLGAVKVWVDMQERGVPPGVGGGGSGAGSESGAGGGGMTADELDFSFCIVDSHAITVPKSREELSDGIRTSTATFLAAGLDPSRAALYVQSDLPQHAELSWILSCLTPLGWLERMTQFQTKASQLASGEMKSSMAESTGTGLLTYPVLMAADILLFDADYVPVGEDQTQHLNLTRDIAVRAGRIAPGVFTVPKGLYAPSAKVMCLQRPGNKMSKSAGSDGGRINLTDAPDVITKKIRRATTDAIPGLDPSTLAERPAVKGLVDLYAGLTAESAWKGVEPGTLPPGLREDMNHGELKKALAEAAVEVVEPIRVKTMEYLADREGLRAILADGAERAGVQAEKKIKAVREAFGMGGSSVL